MARPSRQPPLISGKRPNEIHLASGALRTPNGSAFNGQTIAQGEAGRSVIYPLGVYSSPHAGTCTYKRPRSAGSLNRLAVQATTHCLTGCAIGEFLGMAIATALGWGNGLQIALAVALAYVFGFGLTSLPLARAGLAAG
jgi:hypothetical protein